jgi:hypothetical protein
VFVEQTAQHPQITSVGLRSTPMQTTISAQSLDQPLPADLGYVSITEGQFATAARGPSRAVDTLDGTGGLVTVLSSACPPATVPRGVARPANQPTLVRH